MSDAPQKAPLSATNTKPPTKAKPTSQHSATLPIEPANQLASKIKQLGQRLGFSDIRITLPDNARAATLFARWQALHNAGEMHYLVRHGQKRCHVKQLQPSALRVICVRLDYLSEPIAKTITQLDNDRPFVSLYAKNKDYHKLMRKRLVQFAKQIETIANQSINYRVFVDSAPVLEKPLAEQAGIGWMGKHTNLLHHQHGSFFFLGEIAINLPLPIDHAIKPRCGSCRACIDVCPTKAITAPYQLDAEKCISYLTIEHAGIIPDTLKAQIGNRIYGCDDCQLFCPWNRYAKQTEINGFADNNKRWQTDYLTLFGWDETTFLTTLQGSPIRRIGFDRWQRNLAIGMGNALRQHPDHPQKSAWVSALKNNTNPHPAVIDAIFWALTQKNEGHD
ncbi:tRNA epoxyqueuosine(34) reductase QueG [Ostreibacterium oceani]|uniref:tRNA epoxyqueuosine(34) reductase QueG n=1 Tax=Ostreibacterium oceani TaxID=2654998 RepID=A0A6N7EWN8_9GAMM|nr:tRNA epoxyqueuosine(34) reductase QueG [Ostreibacterium oceani]MPV85537.1 tRNA epoxyqueuosine(34) reductase QueG [Ostreibacterium oceani]